MYHYYVNYTIEKDQTLSSFSDIIIPQTVFVKLVYNLGCLLRPAVMKIEQLITKQLATT